MGADRSHRGAGAGRALAALTGFLGLALAGAALALAAPPTPAGVAGEAAGLSTALEGSTRLVRTRLAPEARALAKGLPRTADRIGSLRRPAATTEEQLSIAFGQLQQMSAVADDPHYLPALLAVGRAHLAASGTDPLTGIAVDPEYAGLGNELAAGDAALQRAAARAGRLSRATRALTKRLAEERRRSARLATALDRLRREAARR